MDVVELIQGAMSWLAATGAKRHVHLAALVCDVATPLLVRVDATRLRQLFINLFSNGIKYSPANAKVGCRLRQADNGGVDIIIWDTGIGIPPEQRAKIFERFYRAYDKDGGYIEGSGLGIAISKAIVDLHGGAITIADNPPRGTQFIVNLPPGRLVRST